MALPAVSAPGRNTVRLIDISFRSRFIAQAGKHELKRAAPTFCHGMNLGQQIGMHAKQKIAVDGRIGAVENMRHRGLKPQRRDANRRCAARRVGSPSPGISRPTGPSTGIAQPAGRTVRTVGRAAFGTANSDLSRVSAIRVIGKAVVRTCARGAAIVDTDEAKKVTRKHGRGEGAAALTVTGRRSTHRLRGLDCRITRQGLPGQDQRLPFVTQTGKRPVHPV